MATHIEDFLYESGDKKFDSKIKIIDQIIENTQNKTKRNYNKLWVEMLIVVKDKKEKRRGKRNEKFLRNKNKTPLYIVNI